MSQRLGRPGSQRRLRLQVRWAVFWAQAPRDREVLGQPRFAASGVAAAQDAGLVQCGAHVHQPALEREGVRLRGQPAHLQCAGDTAPLDFGQASTWSSTTWESAVIIARGIPCCSASSMMRPATAVWVSVSRSSRADITG